MSRKVIVGVMGADFVTALAGCAAAGAGRTAGPAAPAAAVAQEATATVYTCPMHAHVRQKKPGVCTCGMKLKPKTAQ